MANKNLLENVKNTYKKLRKKKKYPPHDNFLERYNSAFYVVEIVEENTSDSNVLNEARKNLLVNLVTAIELYCKEIIQFRKGKWNNGGLSRLLHDEDKISLNDFFELAKIKGLSKEHLLLRKYSFQNVESIDKVFSLLTGEFTNDNFHFISKLEKLEISVDIVGNGPVKTINSEMPDWKNNLRKLFEKRHEIIHEGSKVPIKKNEIILFERTIDLFAWACFIKFELND